MSGIGGEGFCRDPDRASREPVGRRALPTHEKKLATCFLPENQNLCHGVFVGANGSEYRTTRGPTERKGARNKTTANLLIFHGTAESTISRANNFKELQARWRSVFVSQAKFFSFASEIFTSSRAENGKIRFAYELQYPPLGVVRRIKESGWSSLRATAKQSRLSRRMRSPSLDCFALLAMTDRAGSH